MRTARGMSLAEILVAIGVLALALSLPLISTTNRSKGNSRAAAEIVASELKDARERARSSNEPVALGIPNQGGDRAHTQSFVQLAGWKNPRVVRGFSLASEIPDTYTFSGYWSGPAFSRSPAREDLDAVPFEPATWGAPSALSVIVFLPSGAMVTDLPTTAEGCHLVVCNGLAYTAGSVDGVSAFELTGASEPYVVTVSATGGVTTSQGVEGLDATKPGDVPSPPAEFVPPAEGGNASPTAVAELFPKPSGTEATLKLEGFATLRVEADDEDGDRLLCEWTANAGTFSADGPIEMEWDPKIEKWVSWHQWSPPPDAAPGAQFELEYKVLDGRGGEASGTFSASGAVQMLPEGRLLFAMEPDPTQSDNTDLYSVNADGTDVLQLTNHPADDDDAEFSPDGSQVVFLSDRDDDRAIFIMNSDGTGVRRLIGTDDSKLNWIWDPCFDPTGSMIAFCADEDTRNVYVINVDGTLPTIGVDPMEETGAIGVVKQLSQTGWDPDGFQLGIGFWHPSGAYLVLEGGVNQVRGPNSEGAYWDEPQALYRLDLSPTGTEPLEDLTPLANQSTHGARLHNTPGDPVVLFSREMTEGSDTRVQRAIWEHPAGRLKNDTFEPAPVGGKGPSPDGQFVYTVSGGEVAIQPFTGGTMLQLTDTGGMVKDVFGWALIR